MTSDLPDAPKPFGREEGRDVFGRAAAVYAARPAYPERVYETLRDRCRLGPTSRVVEIADQELGGRVERQMVTSILTARP